MDLGYPSHKTEEIVTIKILKTDFNNYKPEFHGQTIFYTKEEVPIGSVIGSLAYVDKDIGLGERVTLSINDQYTGSCNTQYTSTQYFNKRLSCSLI